MFRKDSRNIYQATPLLDIPWIEHGFGTRQSENWPDRQRRVALRQIHSTKSFIVNHPTDCAGEGDALLSGQAGLLLGVRTADCVPILMVEQRQRVVAAVHAGWRGTAEKIAVKTIERIVTEFGGDPAYVHAAIGPGIGVCCYEVGPEVARRFRQFFPETDDLERKTKLDLAEANRRQLLQAGLNESRIYSGAPCTCCEARDFYSYRRSPGEPGRMVSAIGIREGGE